MTAFPPPLDGRRATVLGLGLFGGGVAAARWLVERGARVTVTDLRDAATLAPAVRELAGLDVELVLGEHRARDLEEAALVVANPAVPPDSRWLARARAAGAVVTSEVELFLRTTPARTVLVTGTHGKSSTVHALGQLLEHAGVRARAGGNLGAPLLGCDAGAGEVCVVELSSYQLEALPRPCEPVPGAAAAAVTCVAADHLERHGDVAAYAAAKARIGELCGERAELWLPEDLSAPRFTETPARVRRFGPGAELRVEDGELRLGDEVLGRVEDVPLPGTFQVRNVLLALGLARGLVDGPGGLRAAVPRLRGLPHRLEDLGAVDGVRVLDNGVSTTPESTTAALESVDGPCTLLVGGQRKRGLDFDTLWRAAAERGARAVAFGAAGGELAEELGRAGVPVERAGTLEEAVSRGLSRTPAGGTLLFSPACASFDAYPNFRARALAFRAALGLDP